MYLQSKLELVITKLRLVAFNCNTRGLSFWKIFLKQNNGYKINYWQLLGTLTFWNWNAGEDTVFIYGKFIYFICNYVIHIDWTQDEKRPNNTLSKCAILESIALLKCLGQIEEKKKRQDLPVAHHLDKTRGLQLEKDVRNGVSSAEHTLQATSL